MSINSLFKVARISGMRLIISLLALIRVGRVKTVQFTHKDEKYTLQASLIPVKLTAESKLQKVRRIKGQKQATVQPESEHDLTISLDGLRYSPARNANGETVKGSAKASRTLETVINRQVFLNGTEYSLHVTVRKANPTFDVRFAGKSPSAVLADMAIQDAQYAVSLERKIAELQKALAEVNAHGDKMEIQATALAQSEKQS